MRLGGPIFTAFSSPREWVHAVRQRGYRSAYCPVDTTATPEEISGYAEAARTADIVIAEVGAWSNPLSRDPAEQSAALEKCRRGLALADEIGARCCVNIAGSRGSKWDGPCEEDLTRETFDLIVEVVRSIIDDVRPRRAAYTLEPMPWMYPDSADTYLRLIKSIDRSSFGVHFDPVNLISSPQLYFRSGELVRDFIHRLGPHIKACHVKDIILRDRLTVHLDEVRPGLGGFDLKALFLGLEALDPDLPILLEHLPEASEYEAAAAHVRRVAGQLQVQL